MEKLPEFGTKEFNDLCFCFFGGKPKQETLEEVAHKMLDDYGIKSMGQSIGVLEVKKLMVKMAKWQQERSYSEEEVIKFGQWLSEFNNLDNESEYVIKELLEQFKNK
jgi:hypothetical protein